MGINNLLSDIGLPGLGCKPVLTDSKPRVVIVGAGFGGLAAAEKTAEAGCDVTLIDRNPYTTFQPLLYQVATGGLNPGDVTYRLRSFAANNGPHTHFRRACVTGIDTENRIVEVDNGDPISYDYLVLSQGVGANFFGTPGAAENSYTIYTRASSLRARDAIFTYLEDLDTQRDKTFDVIIVGGGPTGVEMAGTLAEMKSIGIPAIFPDVSTDRVHVTLVEMANHLLMPFDPALRHYTRRQLQKRGVDVRTNTAIAGCARIPCSSRTARLSRPTWSFGPLASVPTSLLRIGDLSRAEVAALLPTAPSSSKARIASLLSATVPSTPRIPSPSSPNPPSREASALLVRSFTSSSASRWRSSSTTTKARWRRSAAIRPSCSCPKSSSSPVSVHG